MNIAILFDSREDNRITPMTLLCGQEMYLYSLKQMLINPEIDAVAMIWKETRTAQDVYERIMQWEEIGEAEKKKKIWIFHDAKSFLELSTYIKRDIREEIDTYVFHSIRYPLVTQKMIKKVLLNVEKNGVAVIVDKIADEIITEKDQRTLSQKDYRIAQYPIAVKKDNVILDGLRDCQDIMQRAADHGATMCETDSRNISVLSADDWEMAEALISVKECMGE